MLCKKLNTPKPPLPLDLKTISLQTKVARVMVLDIYIAVAQMCRQAGYAVADTKCKVDLLNNH